MLKFRRFSLIVLALLLAACTKGDSLYKMLGSLNTTLTNEHVINGHTVNHKVRLELLPDKDWGNTPAVTDEVMVINVNGRVVDKVMHNPKAGARVLLNGTDLQITDSNGNFKFTGVTPPYTLTVKLNNDIYEYRGLTRTKVQLPSGVGYQTTIKGSVSGSSYPLATNEFIGIAMSRPAFGFGSVDSESGIYIGSVMWETMPTITTDVVAVHMRLQGILPESYLGKGKLAGVNLIHGTFSEELNITLTDPVPTSKTILRYDLGTYANGSGSLFSITIDDATLPLRGIGPLPSGVVLRLPSQGASVMVKGKDSKGNTAFVVTPAILDGVTEVKLPKATVLKNSLPLEGAVGVNKAPTLAWTPVSEANFYVVTLENAKLGTRYTWYLPSGNVIEVPDYNLLGAALMGDTTYVWEVLAVQGQGPSVNALTDPTGMTLEYMLLSKPDIIFYNSAATSFTTAPYDLP